MKKRNLLVAALSLCLVAVIAVGGTLAYFTDKTDTVVNTFTTGKVDIALYETIPTKNVQIDGKWQSVEATNRDGTPYVADEDRIPYPGWEGKEAAKALTYTSVLPGDTLSKSINVYIDENSMPCFLAVRLWLEPLNDAAVAAEDELTEIFEDALTRISSRCSAIPETPKDNDFDMPFRTLNSSGTAIVHDGSVSMWTPFRLDDGSVLLVANPCYKNGGVWTGETGVDYPIGVVRPGAREQVLDTIPIDKSYGNELAGVEFTIKSEAFAMQYDSLVSGAPNVPSLDMDDWEDSAKNWEAFVKTVVNACNNGTTDQVFESMN